MEDLAYSHVFWPSELILNIKSLAKKMRAMCSDEPYETFRKKGNDQSYRISLSLRLSCPVSGLLVKVK